MSLSDSSDFQLGEIYNEITFQVESNRSVPRENLQLAITEIDTSIEHKSLAFCLGKNGTILKGSVLIRFLNLILLVSTT